MALQLVQPTRQVKFGTIVRDQFAGTSDGYNKVSDLDPDTQMTVLVYRDNTRVMSPPAVTIAEIDDGEYGLSFTPDQIGTWVIEVRIPSLSLDWRGQYDVTSGVADQVFVDVVRDEQGRGLPYITVEVIDASDDSTLLTSVTTEYDGSYSIPLSGDLAGNPLVNLRFSGNQLVTFTKENLRLG